MIDFDYSEWAILRFIGASICVMAVLLLVVRS